MTSNSAIPPRLLARCHPHHSDLALTVVHPPTDTIYVKHEKLWHLYPYSLLSLSLLRCYQPASQPPSTTNRHAIPITTSTTHKASASDSTPTLPVVLIIQSKRVGTKGCLCIN